MHPSPRFPHPRTRWRCIRPSGPAEDYKSQFKQIHRSVGVEAHDDGQYWVSTTTWLDQPQSDKQSHFSWYGPVADFWRHFQYIDTAEE